MPATLARAQEAEEVAHADDLLAQMRDLQARVLAILRRAEDAGALGVALGAIREARANLELLAKLVGQLDERAQVNILVDPGWLRVRSVLMVALDPYPEARIAVAGSLAALGAGDERGD